MNFVDISKSNNVTKLKFYKSSGTDKTTQVLKYLNVNESDIDGLELHD